MEPLHDGAAGLDSALIVEVDTLWQGDAAVFVTSETPSGVQRAPFGRNGVGPYGGAYIPSTLTPSASTTLGATTISEIGDARLSQLSCDKLAQAFELAEASKNEAEEKASLLNEQLASLQRKKEELEAEQTALQEQQQALYDAADTLKDLPQRVEDLSSAFGQLTTGLSEERQATSEPGSALDKFEDQAAKTTVALDGLKTQFQALTDMSQGMENLENTIGTVQTGQSGLVTQMTNLVNQVDHLAKAVGTVPTQASTSQPTGLMAEVKSTAEVLKTLATKADLEEWSNEEAISQCVKAALKDFQDSTVAEYSRKLQQHEAAEEKKREVFENLRVKALAVEDKYNRREQRLANLEKENSDLNVALQNRDLDLATDLSEAKARIGRRDGTIAGANAQIGMKDTAIAEAESQIRSKDQIIQEARELVESYENKIKAKNSEMEQMRNRLEAAEAQPTPSMTEAQRGAEMSELARTYLTLSTEFQGIPIAPERNGCFGVQQIAAEIAPALIQVGAKAHSSSLQGWYCLDEVLMQGTNTRQDVLSGMRQIHQKACVMLAGKASAEDKPGPEPEVVSAPSSEPASHELVFRSKTEAKRTLPPAQGLNASRWAPPPVPLVALNALPPKATPPIPRGSMVCPPVPSLAARQHVWKAKYGDGLRDEPVCGPFEVRISCWIEFEELIWGTSSDLGEGERGPQVGPPEPR
ncbi:uncharacterized protein NECHADRAFT_83302 [Fusarium vanettenii 77-13-4]|uniref:Uncharacterized protein n=1 Tax=Fusarium vanettenii (strain ATCC MYA-4622 / CBS 123669 / FGSC 9596 / NRRL 45880 / 77-13-4) TaxID=660122 RepID=C7Z3M5_FUSV7|nr:uncharacterized protein NECHADRAFT_83302 [Fusarium vanettenii 77-13-4]EEU41162.1 hypothetical protein NECHADRAFT_83302 [Fusarium vanettenii 77-13-4]